MGCHRSSEPAARPLRSAPGRRSGSTGPTARSLCSSVNSSVTDEVYSCELRSLRGADRLAFGGKSASLGELFAAEIPVPPGFALSAGAYRACVDSAGLRDVVAGGDADAIRAAIRAAPIADGLRDEIGN